MNIIRRILHFVKYIPLRWNIRATGGRLYGNVDFNITGFFLYGKKLILKGNGIGLSTSCKITIIPSAKLVIGNYCGISQSSIYCKNEIVIGNHVNIGADCLIMDSNFHSLDWKIRASSEDTKNCISKPIHIEDHVFIGARSVICKGVIIGARSIIASGSVVTKSVPADCIAGGNPCKVIKQINNDSTTY